MHDTNIYQWIPGQGVSFEAIERMRNHFHKPNYPMGEAWFNTKKRRLYTELIEMPLSEIKNSELSTYVLFDISSGTKSFGHRQEWDEWFKYLLPDLILRCQDFHYFSTMFVQDVVSAFMSVYWKGIPEEYEGFRTDVLNSLSICLMNEDLWFDGRSEITTMTFSRVKFLDTYEDGKGRLRLGWDCGQSDENLSAMMFFCLKYLNEKEIVSWVKSLFAISDVYWKGALMVWLLGAYDILQESIVVPEMIEKANPKLSWNASHCLGSRFGSIDAKYPPEPYYNDNKDFLSSENTKAFLREVRQQMSPELIVEWAELFAQNEFVAEGTYNVPELLFAKLRY